MLKVWNQYKRNDVPKSLHFRLKTRGDVDKTNVHPFRVLSHAEHGREVWIMHNGTISDAPMIEKEKSDTWHFVTYILRPILSENPGLVEDTDFHTLVESMLKGDRMLLLDGTSGKSVRLNATKSGGHVTKDGIWISNNYGLREPYKSRYGFGQSDYLDDDAGGKSNPYGNYRSPASSTMYSNVVFKESKATVYSPYKSLLETKYSRNAKLECMRELRGWLKDGNKNELDFELHISVKNTGTITLNRVGVRLNLNEFLGNKFEDIRITDYKVRGHLTPVQQKVILSNTVFGNNKHGDYLNAGMSGSVSVSVTAKFKGTTEEFKELVTLPISLLYVEVGYGHNKVLPETKDWIKGKEEDTPPWIEDVSIASALAEDETKEKMNKADEKTWGKDAEYANEDLDEDDGILYSDINSSPKWDLDYALLSAMSDSELIDTIREHPEYVADFLREFLDADIG